MGYEPNTDTYARALDAGGMVWSGGHKYATLDENLKAMEDGLRERVEEL